MPSFECKRAADGPKPCGNRLTCGASREELHPSTLARRSPVYNLCATSGVGAIRTQPPEGGRQRRALATLRFPK